MGMTAGMGSQPMTTTGLQAGVVRNMNLPLSRATPIQVTETTPNLEEIQNFPVAGRGLDGTHFHQDPVSGQMYVMTDEFHQRIPEILRNRQNILSGGLTDQTVPFIEESSTKSSNSDINKILETMSFGDEDFSISLDFFQENFKTNDYQINPSIIDDSIINQTYSQYDTIKPINSINNTSAKLISSGYTFSKSIPVNKYLNTTPINMGGYYSTNYIPTNVFYNNRDFNNNASRTTGIMSSPIVMQQIVPMQSTYPRISGMPSPISTNNILTNQSNDFLNTQKETPTTSGVHVFTNYNGKPHVIIKGWGGLVQDGMYELVMDSCTDMGDGTCMVQFYYGFGPGNIVTYRYPGPCMCDP
jgi:hypothetical protein